MSRVHAPGGCHLEHVLYTRYFTSDGASIHYNYWSSNFDGVDAVCMRSAR